jgi:beta-aspartyl-peptidase (threonine type)
MRTTPVIAIHGGAGTISAAALDAAAAAAYHDALRSIVLAGQALLLRGASALDAVCLAVEMLEDCPLFNAGHGAVFTGAETHELDAAVMDGAELRAGAVAGVSRIRHPVHAARAVMDDGAHVLLAGAGAEAFARERGLEMVEPSYFSTEARREQLRRARAEGRVALDHDGAARAAAPSTAPLDETDKFGTVGAVALDRRGHLAAATSTGGMTNKRIGRVGDSPLIGAGTYADDKRAAVSCTGSGEMFIRTAAAYDVCARMRYAGQSLAQAAHAVIMQAVPAIGGSGGLIAIDRAGNLCLPFNTEGMYRGHARGAELPHTAIHR